MKSKVIVRWWCGRTSVARFRMAEDVVFTMATARGHWPLHPWASSQNNVSLNKIDWPVFLNELRQVNYKNF